MASTPEPPQPNGPSPSDVTPRAGEPLLFGRYQVERELGRGGMGRVLLAFDTKLRIHVAIKLVPDQVMADAGAAEDLRTEVLRGIALSHPGIVRTHTFEQDSTGAAIVMEYIDGLSFAEWKEQQPGRCFDIEALLPWLAPLCEALDYAHRDARIVHRDLKPRNIMISHEGRLKVADFGISATFSETSSRLTGTGQGSTSGTPAYMSPQQFQGKKPNPLDDVYGLGATIFDLLTSKPPFFRGTLHAIFHQLLTEQPPSITGRREELEITGKAPIPEVWEQTIAACLAKEPSERPQSCGEVLARLRGQVAASPSGGLQGQALEKAFSFRPKRLSSVDEFQSPTPPTAPPAPAAPISLNDSGRPPLLSADPQLSFRRPHGPEHAEGQTRARGRPAVTRPRRNPKRLVAAAAGVLALGLGALWLMHGKKHAPFADVSTVNATPRPGLPPGEITPATTAITPVPATVAATLSTSAPATATPRQTTAAGNQTGFTLGTLAQATKLMLQKVLPWDSHTAIPLPPATKDAPFVNSLGMRFVPVLGTKVLFSIWDTRVQDYAEYAKAKGITPEKPNFVQAPTHPVVNVSWEDAQGFCQWLSQKEGRTYRFPTDAEWSVAVGLGTEYGPTPQEKANNGRAMLGHAVFPWGKQWPPPRGAGNYADETARKAPALPLDRFHGHNYIDGYNDGYAYTSPVGSYAANRHGLYDMGGNVWQWCEDWYDAKHEFHVSRGGSWRIAFWIPLESSDRGPWHPGERDDQIGFRVVVSGD